MAGGMIVTAGGNRAWIQSFVSTTSLTVTPALTWTTSQAYTIYYSGRQEYITSSGTGGNAMSGQLYIGTAQAAITNEPVTGLSIMGSSTNLGLSIFANDQYSVFQVVGQGHNAIDLLFDANMNSGGSYVLSVGSNKPARIRKGASGQLAVDLGNSGSAGGSVSTWTNAATFISDGTAAGTGIQLNSAAGGTITTLSQYTVDTFNLGWTGPCVLTATNAVAVRVGRIITIAYPSASCTGGTGTFTNSNNVPAQYRPAVSQCQPIIGQNNGVRVQLSINIGTDGSSTIYNDNFCNGGGFTAGTDGFFSFTVVLVST
jgi:hypothetical protein